MSDSAYKSPEWLVLAQVLELTQEEAADAAGVSKYTIGYWEKKHGLERGHDQGDPRLTDADWLRTQYIAEGRSMHDIADELNCTSRAVYCRLCSFNIETRKATQVGTDPRLADESWLRKQYVMEGRSTPDIADELSCNAAAVRYRLHSFNIETRETTQADADPRLADERWLREQYLTEGRSSPDIADELGCSALAVRHRLRSFGVRIRPRSQHAVTENGVIFDSRWERDVAQAFERVDVNWVHHPTSLLGWEPDFLVDEQIYVEVKGLLHHEDGTPSQYAGMAGARWAGAKVVVIGTEEARRALPHDRFGQYDGTGNVPMNWLNG